MKRDLIKISALLAKRVSLGEDNKALRSPTLRYFTTKHPDNFPALTSELSIANVRHSVRSIAFESRFLNDLEYICSNSSNGHGLAVFKTAG